ncbi:flagellar export protein FliJ [Thalassobacillus hwangdonensis]|uniref:Flagellar FliJ protein n=1 Tax=Thalassobacillus hwangdonensis TaxID=546108 RepID=A0ABW3KZ95_9BACI
MATMKAFHKIKDLREKDKQEAQRTYQRKVEEFEAIATELYQALKRKENAEAEFEAKVREGSLSAQYFVQYKDYLQRLDERILSLQPKVQEARERMEGQQETLNIAYIEFKKLEKLIENKRNLEEAHVKREETLFMDDLSLRQYSTFRNR